MWYVFAASISEAIYKVGVSGGKRTSLIMQGIIIEFENAYFE